MRSEFVQGPMMRLGGLVLVVMAVALQGCQRHDERHVEAPPPAPKVVRSPPSSPAPVEIVESPLDEHIAAYARSPEQAAAIRQAAQALLRVSSVRLTDEDGVDDVMSGVQYSLACLRTVFAEGDYRTKVMTTIPYIVLDAPAKREHADKVYARWRQILASQGLSEDDIQPRGSGCAHPLDYEKLTPAEEEARLTRLQLKADELSAELD